MNKLEKILKEAKEEGKVIAENIKAKARVKAKEQDRLHALNIEWSFHEILERHDNNYCEWLVVGHNDGVDYFASAFADANNPKIDEPVFNIEIDK